MSDPTPAARFFADYQRNISEGKIDALVAMFAETYLNGGPHGYQFLHSAALAAGLPRRRQLLDSLGCGPSRLVSLTETPLDARFVLARTRWNFDVAADPAHPVAVDSTFLLDTAEPMRILVYISHQDLVAMLKSRQQSSEDPAVS
jgi:hypothetical protein